jgi:hypothetical protein
MTVGFHRMLPHRSFTAVPVLRVALAIAGSMSFEGEGSAGSPSTAVTMPSPTGPGTRIRNALKHALVVEPQDGTDRDRRDAGADTQHPSGSRRDLLVHRCAHRRDRPRPLLRLLPLPRLVTRW